MTSVTVPSRGRSLLGMGLDALAARARRQGRRSRLAELVRESTLTVAALGAAVADGFTHGPGWGLGVLAAALLVLDFKLQG